MDNNINDNFKDIPFKLTQIKLEHHHFYDSDLKNGMAIKTSVELKEEYDFTKDVLVWKKVISHTYVDLNNSMKEVTDTYMVDVDDSIINKIKEFDLRKLQNNYFTDQQPQNLSHWEISYNNYFKICGTYDQEIKEYTMISELLDFETIITNELNKINNKIKESL